MVQFSSVVQSCPTLCGPVGCSTPGFPVLHQLSELVQTHVYRVSDASQPSHPLSSPSPPAFNLCQHQSLLQWVSSSHQVAKVWLDVPKIPSLEPGFEDKLSLDTMVEQAQHNHSPEKGLLHYLGVKKIWRVRKGVDLSFVGQTEVSWAGEGQVGKACSGYHRGME